MLLLCCCELRSYWQVIPRVRGHHFHEELTGEANEFRLSRMFAQTQERAFTNSRSSKLSYQHSQPGSAESTPERQQTGPLNLAR